MKLFVIFNPVSKKVYSPQWGWADPCNTNCLMASLITSAENATNMAFILRTQACCKNVEIREVELQVNGIECGTCPLE